MSSRPNRSTVCWMTASAWMRSAMSAGITSAVPPAFSISAARSSRRSLRRATSATEAPASASWRAVAAPIPLLAPVTRATVPVSVDAMGSGGVVVGQRAGQFAVGVGLGEQLLGLLLEHPDGVDAGRPAQRRLGGAGELDQRSGELGRVAALEAVHAVPGGDGLLGAFGVVVDRGL